MSKRPSFQFYPADWLNNASLQSCGAYAAGVYINILCLMHQSEKYGYLLIGGRPPTAAGIAKALRGNVKGTTSALQRLVQKGVLKKDTDGVLYSPRMVEQGRISDLRRAAGKQGGSPLLLKQTVNQKPTPSSSSSSSASYKTTPLPPSNGDVGDFERLCRVYPRADDLEAALKEYQRIDPTKADVDAWILNIEGRKKTEQWQKEGGRYISMLKNYLSQGQYNDAVPESGDVQAERKHQERMEAERLEREARLAQAEIDGSTPEALEAKAEFFKAARGLGKSMQAN